MSGNNEQEPERVFRPLRERPVPEIDAERLWHRLQPQLRERAEEVWW